MNQEPSPINRTEQADEAPVYERSAQSLIDNVQRMDSQFAYLKPQMMDSFLQTVLDDAAEGKLVRQKTGEAYQESDIKNALFFLAHNMNTEQASIDTLKVVPRSGGLRRAVVTLLSNPETSNVFIDRLLSRESQEKERQALQQEELGEQALEMTVERPITEPYAYLKELLPPVLPPEQPNSSVEDYSVLLFGSDEEVAELQNNSQNDDPEAAYYKKFVTEKNRHTSQDFLQEVVKADPEILQILAETNLQGPSIEAVDAIRENEQVRFKVAQHLRDRLEKLVAADPEGFGRRIVENSANNLKVDPQTGNKLRSRDYVVSLALKMIGGEFDDTREADDFRRDESGRVIVGQHRNAATTLLITR